MKNIHVLPTEKLSKGYIVWKCIKELSDVKIGQFVKTHYLMFSKEYFQPHNIYITNSEEIKEKTLIFCFKENRVIVNQHHTNIPITFKKIILTTDEQLIADSVQAIDDEFLKWFVNNPSCENVEIVKEGYKKNGMIDESTSYRYKIIIPKEEPKQYTFEELEGFEDFKKMVKPKQETIEEAAEKESEYLADYEDKESYQKAFIEGAKWQAKRMFSEEEVLQLLHDLRGENPIEVGKWFEQFKKK